MSAWKHAGKPVKSTAWKQNILALAPQAEIDVKESQVKIVGAQLDRNASAAGLVEVTHNHINAELGASDERSGHDKHLLD
jgi:hypothetical protein